MYIYMYYIYILIYTCVYMYMHICMYISSEVMKTIQCAHPPHHPNGFVPSCRHKYIDFNIVEHSVTLCVMSDF